MAIKIQSIKIIKDSLPIEKNRNDALFVSYIVRPISFILTIPFIYFKVSANSVSYIALTLSIIAIFVISQSFLFGSLLLFAWIIIDCIDGNIARVTKTSNEFGGLIDSSSSFFISLSILPAMSIMVMNGNFSFMGFFLLSNFTVIIIGFSHIIYQKYKYSLIKSNFENSSNKTNNLSSIPYMKSKSIRVAQRIRKDLGISGFFIPILAIGDILGFEFYLWIFFTIMFLLQGILTIIMVLVLAQKQCKKLKDLRK